MLTTVDTYHIPVLLKESVDGLDIQSDGVYVDVTFGGGRYSHAWVPRAICTASIRMPMQRRISSVMIDLPLCAATSDI